MHIVNVRGQVALSNLMLPHMRSARKVRIINISSKAAITSLPMMTAYSSTKASMLSFTSYF
jgi:short-subunit dehydrogenase